MSPIFQHIQENIELPEYLEWSVIADFMVIRYSVKNVQIANIGEHNDNLVISEARYPSISASQTFDMVGIIPIADPDSVQKSVKCLREILQRYLEKN